jgi:NhaA family Na+:H+ antiporter
MVLIVCTVLALLCANIPVVKDWYFSLWQHEVSVSIGNFNLFSHGGHAMSLMEVINDFLMAIFFLSVGLEIKREIRVGELSSRDKALLPIIGACGGMIVPVLLFWLVCPGDAAMQRICQFRRICKRSIPLRPIQGIDPGKQIHASEDQISAP